jgi:mono/diheme cytochrome c family protein
MVGKFLKWGAVALGVVAVATLGFVGWVYAASEAHLRSFEAPPAFAAEIPTDAASLARGEHLVVTRGCGGCHGDQLQGQPMWEMVVTPNLASYAREQDVATFERALRHGIDHTGRGMYSMPSFSFMNMHDEDVTALYAYLRSAPVAEGPASSTGMPFALRLMLARGQDDVMPEWIKTAPRLEQQSNPNASIARGENVAMTTCNECHGFSLRADVPWESDGRSPDLVAVVAGYEEADFRRLMREGVPIGGRDLELMDDVARGRFVHFTDEEVGDLFAYLNFRSGRLLEEGR